MIIPPSQEENTTDSPERNCSSDCSSDLLTKLKSKHPDAFELCERMVCIDRGDVKNKLDDLLSKAESSESGGHYKDAKDKYEDAWELFSKLMEFGKATRAIKLQGPRETAGVDNNGMIISGDIGISKKINKEKGRVSRLDNDDYEKITELKDAFSQMIKTKLLDVSAAGEQERFE